MADDRVSFFDFVGGIGDFFGGLWRDITGITASEMATEAQTEAQAQAIEEMRRQFEEMQDVLSPYVEAGTGALSQQQALLGLSGPEAQQEAIRAIQEGPGYQEALKAGETSILQNAAATGGLRGGNVQGALGQFAPQMLNQAIGQQLGQLGGIAGMGQASAAGVGAGAAGLGQNISSTLGQMGSAQAANLMNQYNLQRGFITDLAGLGIGLAGLF